MKAMNKNEENASTVNNSSRPDTSTHETGTQPTPQISPELSDAIQKLREVFLTIVKFYNSNEDMRDSIDIHLPAIEDALDKAAHGISEIAGIELMNNRYYNIKGPRLAGWPCRIK
jgi:hypothetical protein